MASRYPCKAIGRRVAMTLVEVTVTLAIIGVLGVIVAQCVVWSLHEKARAAAQQTALELAANVLEAARAQPWDQLDKAWADSQTIPSEIKDRLPGGKVLVTVEPWRPAPNMRRVTAEVRWEFESYMPQSVSLTTLLSARELKKEGGKP